MLQQTSDGTRGRLIRAALELFTTTGFHATTTPMLAARAGVAEGTIYRHFKSKEALLNEVFRETQRWGTEMLRVEAERGGRAPDVLQRFGRRLVEAAGEAPAAVRMLLHAPAATDRHVDERSREAAREFRAALQQVVAGGKSDGLVRTGAADLWASVWLAVVAFAAERVAARDWTADHAHVTATLDAAWSAVRERTSAPAGAGADWSNPLAGPAPAPVAEPRAVP